VKINRSCITRLAAALLGSLGLAGNSAAADALQAGFSSPPNAARPRVWWHWMNGNITKEGIKLDLEWMHRTGIGGFQNFDAALGTPKVVDQRLVFMTPQWRDAFHYAMTLADQLGLEAAIAGSPGWSESGGPWVKPQQAMKKVTWSETTVEGGKAFKGTLAKPPVNSGPFQDAPFIDMMAPPGAVAPSFYADTAVIAFKLPAVEAQPLMARAQVSSSGNAAIDASRLWNGSLADAVALPIAPANESAWIRFDFDAPETVRALVYASADHGFMEQFSGGGAGPDLEASDDGEQWRKVTSVPGSTAAQQVISFDPVTARHFRAVFLTRPPAASPMGDMDLSSLGFVLPPPPKDRHIAELRLESGARVLRAGEKAGFANFGDVTSVATPLASADAVIARSSVVDLTQQMQPDGSLVWNPPAGHWLVLRMGYSLTGVTNHPASPEGTGLEVDKLSAAHVRDYLNHYLDLYKEASGGLMGKRGLQYLVSDSYEAGAANWTEDLLAQFRRRRGYEAAPWLPVLTGRLIESSALSDRFLWDYRQTLAELFAENHYELTTRLLHERGMGHYGESHESGRVFTGDGMDVKRSNDVPMSAMWTQKPGVNEDNPGYNADIRESASVAHIYGQNLVAAESMTASSNAWQWSPATLKPTADKELAMGLNRFVIHTSVHQPLLDRTPGFSLGPFGQWFTRNETWSGAGAKAWIDYLSRSSYLLQQGHFVADVAWFYGEDANVTALYAMSAPPIPAGYNFDYVNAHALRNRLKVIDGRLATDSGMRYRVLALDARAARMSLPVLKAIRELVKAGAVVSGPRPLESPSLADNQQEFQAIVREVWGPEGGSPHAIGNGHAYTTSDLSATLRSLGVTPDFQYSQQSGDARLLFVHRQLADGDLYFVNNRRPRPETLEISLRVSGRVPELWHAETGRIEAVAWRRAGGRTIVSLALDPWDAVFVVLRRPSAATAGKLPARRVAESMPLPGPWQLSFEPGRGAPATIEVGQLESWSKHGDPGVRYFAGTGTYHRTLDVPAASLGQGSRLWLDLGEVHELAEVRVNGQSLGVVWRPPYRMDLTPALHAGNNTLEVAVTDLWVNRLIRDAQAEETHKISFTVPVFYRGKEPLLPAGLIGPVTLERTVR
jgi:hypothetical protein